MPYWISARTGRATGLQIASSGRVCGLSAIDNDEQ